MNSQGGFTLGELLLTLAITSVLLVGAVPGFVTLQRENRLTAVTNELITALYLARSEAVKRGTRVTFCASTDGEHCAVDGLGYQRGWIVFTDPNDSGDLDAGEVALAVSQARVVTIKGNALVQRYVSYVATGAARTTSGALQMGTLTLCSPPSGREVTINVGGRVRVSRIDC